MQDKPKSVASKNLIAGAKGDWEVIVGLEVHAQVASKSKLFSGASTAFGGDPNSHVSLVDAAMPGMLPVINAECIAQAVRTGLGLKAAINLRSVFDRTGRAEHDLVGVDRADELAQHDDLVGHDEPVDHAALGDLQLGAAHLAVDGSLDDDVTLQ